VELYLAQLAHAYRSAMHARLHELEEVHEWGLRPPAIGTLQVVSRLAPVSQREVGERLGVHPSDMVRVVDQLEQHGLVSRVRSEEDRRRYDLALTAKGKQALERFSAVAREVDEGFYRVLTPSQRTQLQRLLAKLVEDHFR
jgi:MarR family transcriptional regulator, lower aerobic nicotinate degradation pathway regulator